MKKSCKRIEKPPLSYVVFWKGPDFFVKSDQFVKNPMIFVIRCHFDSIQQILGKWNYDSWLNILTQKVSALMILKMIGLNLLYKTDAIQTAAPYPRV